MLKGQNNPGSSSQSPRSALAAWLASRKKCKRPLSLFCVLSVSHLARCLQASAFDCLALCWKGREWTHPSSSSLVSLHPGRSPLGIVETCLLDKASHGCSRPGHCTVLSDNRTFLQLSFSLWKTKRRQQSLYSIPPKQSQWEMLRDWTKGGYVMQKRLFHKCKIIPDLCNLLYCLSWVTLFIFSISLAWSELHSSESVWSNASHINAYIQSHTTRLKNLYSQKNLGYSRTETSGGSI